jgi:hypothetical protein
LQKKQVKKLKLYTIWKTKEGVYFVNFYESLRQRFTGGTPDTTSLNFKLYGHAKEDYRAIIKALKLWLEIETAVGCPGHTTGRNNIQEIVDSVIYFWPKFERQQKHNAKIKNLFGIENQRVEIIQKNKVTSALLCDDISTTGETLYIFETMLKRKCGVERVEKFVVGHKKEEAEKAFMVAIQEPLDTMDLSELDLDGLLV